MPNLEKTLKLKRNKNYLLVTVQLFIFISGLNFSLTSMAENYVQGVDYRLLVTKKVVNESEPELVSDLDLVKDLGLAADAGSDSFDPTSDSANPATDLVDVPNIELFYWFGCLPCQMVERSLNEYKQLNPNVSVKFTPLTAHISWRQQAYLQPLMEQLSAHTVLPVQVKFPSRDDIYQDCVNDCQSFAQFSAAENWFKQTLKVSELPVLNKEAIWQAEKAYKKRAEAFSITQVPTMIVSGKYVIDANSAKSAERLIAIMDFLLNKK